MAAMALIITLQVVLRWFSLPLAWSVELSQIFFVEITFIGCYLGSRRGKQIIVDMFQEMLPFAAGDVCYRISALITCGYFGVITYYCLKLWPRLMSSKTPIMHVATGYIYIGIIFGSMLMMLAAIFDCIKGKPHKKEMNLE